MERYTIAIAEKVTGNIMTYTGDLASVQKFANYYRSASRKAKYNIGSIAEASAFVYPEKNK